MDLKEFTKKAEDNFHSILDRNRDIVLKIKEIDGTFDFIAKNIESKYLLQPFFLIKSNSLYRAAARIGLGGQVPEGYPLLRAMLEQAFYGWYLKNHPDLEKIWLNRMDSSDDRKLVKNKFQLKKILNELYSGTKIGGPLNELYESFIDYGAHPNVFGVLGESEILKTEDEIKFNIQYLYGNGSFLNMFLKDLARAGVGALYLFLEIFTEELKHTNIESVISGLAKGL